ncbi:MAG: microcompartment protein [Clostridia bacterium]|jgi:microcompartment protein CcmL/EutN|nr:microcompartment protein [Clostridia bacterium]
MDRYNTYNLSAIGVVEVNFYTNAVMILDEMLKTSEVQLVSCEKKLGGRLVSIIVAGDNSSVTAAVESAIGLGKILGEKNIKVAVAISNPHPEIVKLLNLIKKPADSHAQPAHAQPAQAQVVHEQACSETHEKTIEEKTNKGRKKE